MSSGAVCASCQRAIDAFAKLCPYCGANPATGERIDTQAILQEVFRPREVTTTDNVLAFARQRQGVVIPIIALIAFLLLAGLHQFVSSRNATAVTDAPAVPLSELTDVTKQGDETRPVPMPNLDFQYTGRPQAMRTYILERGAIAPAPPAPPTTTSTGAAPAAAAPAVPQQPQPARPTPPQPR